jgi:hypothetical protein
MPNGKPGDHPLTDIVVHGLSVFSPEIDELVRRLARAVPPQRLAELVPLGTASLPELRARLQTELERATREAEERGT